MPTGWMPGFSLVRLLVAAGLVLSPAGTLAQDAPPTAASAPFTVLVTNDDGFEAPGLEALVTVFLGMGEVVVAAPSQNQTAKAHSLTLSEPVVVRQRSMNGVKRAFAIDGTPATAVRVAIEHYLPRLPDLVVSGVNRGENLGMSVHLSGTVGAAREAAFAGVPAVAVSIMGNRPETYATAARFVRGLVEDLRIGGRLRAGLLLNVNVPAGDVKGVKVARLGLRASKVEHACTAPVGEQVACFPRFAQTLADEADTDIAGFYQGYITVTPLTVDATDRGQLEPLRVLERVPVPPR